ARWFAVPGNSSLRGAAQALELDFNTVKRDWMELLRRYGERDAVAVEARRRLAVNRYRYIQQEAHDAWQRSKGDKERRTAKKREQPGAGGRAKESLEATTTTERRLPENNFLRTMAHCEDRICELEQTNPSKEVSGPDGSGIPVTAMVTVVEDAAWYDGRPSKPPASNGPPETGAVGPGTV